MVLKGSWLLLFLALCTTGTIAQMDLRAEQRAMLLGDARGVIARLEAALKASDGYADVLQKARIMEALGEQYHRLSDIDQALHWWKLAFDLRVDHFGDASAEAGVGYAYLARYHSYMSAAMHSHKPLAMEAAKGSMERLDRASANISDHESLVACREFAYAYKIMYGPDGSNKDGDLTTTRNLFRQALGLASTRKDTIWMAQIHHDIGNTHTDRLLRLRTDPIKLHGEVGKARLHYRRSLALLESIGLSPSEASMMDHFTMGLLYRYAYGTDSLNAALNELDLALTHLARTSGPLHATDPLCFAQDQLNRAQALELMHYRSNYLYELFEASGKATYLEAAIRTSDAALPYWEAMLHEYRSEAFYKVVGSYGHYLFQNRSRWLAERFWITQDPKDALGSLLASERYKNTVVQRQRIRRGSTSTSPDPLLTLPRGPRSKPGTLVINYLLGPKILAHVISQKGIEVVELPELPEELFRGFGHTNSFSVHLFNEGPAAYATRAHQFYQVLLEPILRGRSEKDLVIISDSHFAHLPFDALTTTSAGDQWSTLDYLGTSHTIRYAQSLYQALGSTLSMKRDGAVAASVQHDTLSELPFTSKLIRDIGQWFPSHALVAQLSSGLLDSLVRVTGLLHIATHAHAPDLPDALPYLVLSDGPFTTQHLDLTGVDRQLVVLNTCSSGDGQVYIGAGVISMGNAFLDAGAGAVVHTLWPVDDRSTSEVLGQMYEGLDEGLPLGRALQQAKTKFIQAHRDDGLSHPFHWAGIIHAGHDVILDPARRSHTWAYLTGGLFCFLVFFLYRRSNKRSARSATTASLE